VIPAIPARFSLLSENLTRESVEIRARAPRSFFFEHLILHLCSRNRLGVMVPYTEQLYF
jgi:hypothetical protein